MGLIKNKKLLKNKKPQPLESYIEKKLAMYVTIVNQGGANSVIKIFEKCGASANFVELGEGTARKEIRDILGIENNNKEIVFSIISKDKAEDVKTLLDLYFSARVKNAGISFSIPLSSVIGVKIYQFLADTIQEEK